jgi:branched-chain amino acid transport system substrate-binding protein
MALGRIEMRVRKLALALAAGAAVYAGFVTAVAAETLKVGIIAPLTGPGAPWGMAIAEGAKILADQYNAEGGLDIGGKKYDVQIVAYDDKFKAPDAVAAYQRLVYQDGVKYIAVASGVSTMAIKQYIEDDKVICMTAGYVAEELDPNSYHMYRMWGIPADYFPAIYKWLADNTTERKIVIMNPDDETARKASAIAEKELKSQGYNVLLNDLFERSTKDFLPILTRVVAANPDIIDLGTTAPAMASLIITQAREFGYKGKFFLPGSSGWREILAGSGPAYSEGLLNMVYVDPKNESYKRFAAEYTKRVGQEPNESLAPYSDGVNVLIRSIAASGNANDTSKFEEGFKRALPMKSIQGETLVIDGGMKYGIDHQVLATRLIGQIKNGQLEIVGKIQ